MLRGERIARNPWARVPVGNCSAGMDHRTPTTMHHTVMSGSVRVKVVPAPVALATRMSPPSCCMMPCATASPQPALFPKSIERKAFPAAVVPHFAPIPWICRMIGC